MLSVGRYAVAEGRGACSASADMQLLRAEVHAQRRQVCSC